MLKHLDDLLYFSGTASIAVGLFQSPFPWLGWIAIGASLMWVGWHFGKNS